MKFLLNCRKCKIIPVCLNYKVHIHLNSERSIREIEKVLFKQKIRILSVMIADAKRTVAELQKKKVFYNAQMDAVYKPADAQAVRELARRKGMIVFNTAKQTEKSKIDKLKTKRIADLNQEVEWIKNTTNTHIPDFLERTLMCGPNFNTHNKHKTPYIEIAAEVEKSIRFKENADDIRAEMSNIMVNHINYQSQPRHHEHDWIRQDIRKSQAFLKEHPDLLITKADKGNKTVILSSEEYNTKMNELLEDENTYRPLRGDPSTKVLKQINGMVDRWFDHKYIDKRTQMSLKVSTCNPPRIYGLPKTHKQHRPLRPVVSTIGSATYNIAKFLTDIITNMVGKTQLHVKNSFEFAQEITREQFSESAIMFSLDVTSLYTNVPVDFALECLSERWNEIENNTAIDKDSFLKAVKLVLESTFFVYRGNFYQQTFGVPMGSPLSPVIANVVMERLEQECMGRLEMNEIPVQYYRRYVDDCVFVAEREHVQRILDTFNSFHSRLKFTIEKEVDHGIKFLDMMLNRQDGKISTVWLPKQKNGRYLDFTSESPFQHKRNTTIALLDRAIKLTNTQDRPEAIRTACDMLRRNNYPQWFIRKTLKQRVHNHYNSAQRKTETDEGVKYVSTPYVPGLSEKLAKVLRENNRVLASKPKFKIKNMIFSKLKDPIPKEKQKNVVYEVPCGTGDNKVYIGQTGRCLDVRLTEHKNDTKKKDARTGLSLHTQVEGHKFDFNNTKILERIDSKETRLTAEMFHIKVCGEENTVNLQRECGVFNNTYNGLISKLRKIYR